MFNKSLQIQHKKAQTLNQLIDVKLLQQRQKTQPRNFQSATDMLLDEDPHCLNCLEQLRMIVDLREQLKQHQQQIDILTIEKDVLARKEEQTIKQLSQEIERIRHQQKRQSDTFQNQLEQFMTDSRLWKTLQTQIKNKDDALQFQKQQTEILESKLNQYADLLHKQYEFAVSMNIKFATLQSSLTHIHNLLQKFLKLTAHLYNQTSPNLEYFLPTPPPPKDCLQFTDLADMTTQIQQIQLTTAIQMQLQADQMLNLIQDHLQLAQRHILNDMSRCIL